MGSLQLLLDVTALSVQIQHLLHANSVFFVSVQTTFTYLHTRSQVASNFWEALGDSLIGQIHL